MSAAQPVNVPKNVQQKLPECEAYVESLSLSPEQKQMFAQAARNVRASPPLLLQVIANGAHPVFSLDSV